MTAVTDWEAPLTTAPAKRASRVKKCFKWLMELGVPSDDRDGLRKRCRNASGAAWLVAVVVVLGTLELLFNAIAVGSGTVEAELTVPWFLWIIALLAYVGYWTLMSKALLARRKLHELASLASLWRGMAVVWAPGVVAALVLGVSLVLVHASSDGVSAWHWLLYLLTTTTAVSTAALMAHCAEYPILAAALSLRRAKQLKETINQIGDMAVDRLDHIQTEALEGKTPITAKDLRDVLPDREMTADALRKLVERLEKRLDRLSDDMRPWIEAHGVVALLFHPDYLPHISSSELQVSQLRALNIVPRRVQLLTRRWSLSGLESEYVVVHDVSDIRPGFGDQQQSAHKQRSDEGSDKASRSEGKLLSQDGLPSMNGDEPSKWRFLPLKKRAVVHLAPDGALRLIAIQEERQFNI